tara:strand:- start:671 stop:1030 length:360 start_codon:yes stop_codon:yes gene_type:complete
MNNKFAKQISMRDFGFKIVNRSSVRISDFHFGKILKTFTFRDLVPLAIVLSLPTQKVAANTMSRNLPDNLQSSFSSILLCSEEDKTHDRKEQNVNLNKMPENNRTKNSHIIFTLFYALQ